MTKIVAAFSGFSVGDLARAQEFYVDKLGLEATTNAMGLDIKLPGGGKVFVYEKPDHKPADYTVLNLVVENIDDAVEELKSKGVNFEIYDNMPAPQDEKGILRGLASSMGPDIAWFKDPDGNIMSIMQDA